MSKRVYIELDEDLYEQVDGNVSNDEIIDAIRELVEQNRNSDELSQYDSVADIKDDKSLSESKRVRLQSKALRRPDIPTR